MFSFCKDQTPKAFMACCSNAKSWSNAGFLVDDRLRHCKHISLEFPSYIFIVGLSTRVGEQPNCDSTCFSGCEFFFAIRLYNCNHSHLDMSDLHSWFIGQSVALCKREIASSDPKRCAFALLAKAHQHFLNLRNPNHLFPTAIIDCLREAKCFLQIHCANESSFAKTIQLFKRPDARSIEMRLQIG